MQIGFWSTPNEKGVWVPPRDQFVWRHVVNFNPPTPPNPPTPNQKVVEMHLKAVCQPPLHKKREDNNSARTIQMNGRTCVFATTPDFVWMQPEASYRQTRALCEKNTALSFIWVDQVCWSMSRVVPTVYLTVLMIKDKIVAAVITFWICKILFVSITNHWVVFWYTFVVSLVP